MFRTVPLSSGVSHCTHSNGICHTGLLTACEKDQDGLQFRPDPPHKLSANLYDIYHCCVYSEKLLMMGRETFRSCRLLFQNKFEELVHLVGFIVRKAFRCVNVTFMSYRSTHCTYSQHSTNKTQCSSLSKMPPRYCISRFHFTYAPNYSNK